MANAEENNFCFATVVTGAAICLPLIYAMLIRVKRQKLYKEIPMVENSDGRTISAVDKPNPPKFNGTRLAIASWCVKNIWFFRYLCGKQIHRHMQMDKFLERRIEDSIQFMPYEDYPCKLPPSLLEATDSYDHSQYEYDDNDISWLENLADEKVHVNDRATCLHYHKAYKDGTTTPSEVAEIVIENIKILASRQPHLNIVTQSNPQDIREQAAASTERYRNGEPLSLLDGVPLAIKDFFKVKGYYLTHGTAFKGWDEKCERDANEVNRLKTKAGALVIGITSAHECGLGATGTAVNRLNKPCRNAINVNYMAGGSSGGSGAAVGSGLCPLAIGTDGGGSIRIPSSFNGIVGLKPTFNRIFHEPLRSTLATSGPMCWTTSDALLAYHYLNGPSTTLTALETQSYPPKSVFRQDFPALFQEGQLPEEFRIGVDRSFIKQAYDPKMADCCLDMADLLVEHKGAKLVEISIPETFESFNAFVIIFMTEGGFYSFYGVVDHFKDEFSPNLILQSAYARSVTAWEYLLACQQKSRMSKFMREIFTKVDVIMLPTTGMKAPQLVPSDLYYGRLDSAGDLEIARFTWLANLTGLPAITLPLFWESMISESPSRPNGDSKGAKNDNVELPCAIQMVGSWWREDNSFLATRAMEKLRNEMIEGIESKQGKGRMDYMLNVNSLPR